MSAPEDDDIATTSETPVGDEPSLVADRYRILRTLGKGGGGHVWLARDEKLGREVTLKRVGGEADSEMLLTRGMREARTSATLAHENVVRVYDAFEHDGSPWIVMEYVPGPSLAELLEGGRRLPVDQVATIGSQLATALAAAHRAGILHRDVKPGNVLLRDQAGRDAKLTDFGIARAEEDHQLTQTGFVSGTAAYFSPELARGEDPSPAADVWALGATLYCALEGRKPFPDRPNAVAQLHVIAREQPRAPEHAGPLTAVLAGMLDPDPEARWDAARAARELEGVASGGSGPTSWPAGGAGAAAATAAARQGPPPSRAVPDEATQSVPPADSTRALARQQPPRADPGPAPRTDRPAGRPQATQRRSRRTAMWLGWLLAVPLLAALGWLVWTIADGVRSGDGTDPTSITQPTDAAPVTVAEAVALADRFYVVLSREGAAGVAPMLGPDVEVDPDVRDGLTGLRYEGMVGTQREDGSVLVTSTVSYTYGESTQQQGEELLIGRTEAGGEPVVLARTTQESEVTTQESEATTGGED